MSHHPASRHALIEPLEARIAPASAIASATWVTATFGAPIALHAGEGLSTAGANAGTYLLYVEAGDCLVFLTDLNNNGQVDFNEVTGIAAGDGLSLTSFVDIHGDIATNLVKTTASVGGAATTVLTLSDSDLNPSNDPFNKLGDGRVLLNNSIAKIELRSLTTNDLTDQNGDGVVDDTDIALRKANTTFSIFGNIYAGKSFGVPGGGLIIDNTGATALTVGSDADFGFAANTVPSVGSIRTGTAASNEFFSYGASNLDDINGTFVNFTPPKGQVGGDIESVHSADPTSMKFNLNGLFAGDGGIGARGGNISDVTITGDDTGGYKIVAGNGGRGPSGGVGGSIINFNDLGSTTSKVEITAGTGGKGATGTGGDGGTLSFQTFNVYGNVNIDLGSGADGFRSGGNGASLAKGVFSQPTSTAFVPGNAVGTMHQSTYDPNNAANNDPMIGTHQGVDFNGDGFGDLVYTSKTTNQLVVQLGDGAGGFLTQPGPDGTPQIIRYYLNGARNVEAITVGDFNGDGHPDIAVASSDLGSQEGVVVFLAKYEDLDNNGLSSAEDLNHNGINDFVGFKEPRYSVLPQLDRGDPNTINAVLPFWQGPHQITALAAGDFNGDGKTELAAVVTYYGIKTTDATTGAITALSGPAQTVLFLTPDQEVNNSTGATELTGQFYADFGTKQTVVAGSTVPPAPETPFIIIAAPKDGGTSDRTSVVIEASALTDTATHDVLFVGVRDAKNVFTIDYSARANATPPAVLGAYNLGQVDTDRLLSIPATPTTGFVSHKDSPLADVQLEDFTVADYNGDGIADLGAISSTPQGFMVGVKGNGAGGGTQTSGAPLATGPANQAGDNAGNFFYAQGYGFKPVEKLLAIKSFDANGDGSVDDFVVLMGGEDVVGLHYQEGPQPPNAPAAATTGAVLSFAVGVGTTITNGPEFFFGVYLPQSADETNPNFMTDGELGDPLRPNTIDYFSPFFGYLGSDTIGDVGFTLKMGDGGNSIVGKGGIGGVLGGPAKFVTATNNLTGLKTTTITPAISFVTSGASVIDLVAGNGGDGFSTGGTGGSITGVSVRGNAGIPPETPPFDFIAASLTAGDGGRGVSGAGGDGGTLSQNTIEGGTVFAAGSGGPGRTGGNGGDVLGNGSLAIDGSNVTMTVTAGDGGNGDKKGGSGGNITHFHPFVGDPSIDPAGFLSYTAGFGGNAVSGPGGSGGSIIDSSPLQGDGISEEILLQAGDGGSGLSGGAGGNISKFVVSPAAQSKGPQIVSFIGGQGGDGTSGNGGTGGSVTDITVPTQGKNLVFALTAYDFDRILGGDGGASSGGKGGKGGDVKNITSGATDGSFAIVGGAGGNGLTYGGKGGSIFNTDIFLAASAATKALVVGGIGGDATAFIGNPKDGTPNQDNNAFGGQQPGKKGKPGHGGEGGDINGFTQSGSIGAHVDLIAGNGGNTINYGSIADTFDPFVGTGGSITNVKVTGDIGNVTADDPNTPANENIPIKGYNNILGGETMSAWVDTNLRPTFGGLTDLDDNVGNVGIVVGAAGRNKAVVTNSGSNPADPTAYRTQPAQGGVNGNLISIEARNIMSAVAGSVDLIASIQLTKGIRVLKFIIGADKGVIGANDYLDPFGVPTTTGDPVLDGRLVDGALITKVLLDSSGKPITLPGRIFNL